MERKCRIGRDGWRERVYEEGRERKEVEGREEKRKGRGRGESGEGRYKLKHWPSDGQCYTTHTFLTNFPLSRLMMTASSISMSSKSLMEAGWMPMM